MQPVIVLGGGPVGLGAALELARCKIPSILVERNETTSRHPKTRNFNTRTMEIARGWGRDIYDELRGLDLPREWKSPIRFMRSVVGAETGSIESRGFLGASPDISPVSSVLSSQDMIEPVMLRHARACGVVDVRFGHEMIEFVHGADPGDTRVAIRVRDKASGAVTMVEGTALVAADGAGSTMRSVLKMPMHGTARIAHYINCYFTADLEKYAASRPGILLFVSNDKAAGVFQPLDARGRWLCQISVPEDQWSTDIFTPERCARWVRDAAGVDDLEVQVQSVGKWQKNALVAEEFVVGRVLLVGDAVHMFPPTGGLGVNTGIQGMHNAIWKLALALRGKAGWRLIDTYKEERRPYARWVADQSFHNTRQVAKMGLISRGAAGPGASTEEVLRETRRYGNQLGLELGTLYESRAVSPDGSAPPAVTDPYVDYVPTGRPGHRAPHVWLRRGVDRLSTLDLFGPEFTLLAGPAGGPWLEAAARLVRETGLDIDAYRIGSETLHDEDGCFSERYGIEADGAVLVRPDGVVGWRSRTGGEAAAQSLDAALKRMLS